MPETAAVTVLDDDDGEDELAATIQQRTQEELNEQFRELTYQARELLAVVKGRRGIRRDEDWYAIFRQAKIDHESGRFLIKRLGGERFLEPELMATLAQLRTGLLAGIEHPSAADRMMADSAVLAYRNMLRVQGWICSICLVVERELFGQSPLNEIHGSTAGEQLEQQIARLEEVLMPLLERCHRMMARSFAYLEVRQSKTPAAAGQDAQANVALLLGKRRARCLASA